MSLKSTEIPSEPGVRRGLLVLIFIGDDGLRAGWSLLLFLMLVVVIGKAQDLLLSLLHHASPNSQTATNPVPPGPFLSTWVSNFIVLAIATWVMSNIERRPLKAYGGGGSYKLRKFSLGCLSGFFCVALLVGCLWMSGLLVFDSRVLGGASAWNWGAVWFVGFLAVAFAEESSLRAYMQFTLTRGLAGIFGRWSKQPEFSTKLAFWSAAAILACLFASNHSRNPGESPMGLFNLGIFAMLMCFSLWRTGSLWWAVGCHTVWDWSTSFLFGVANSGWVFQGRLLAMHPVGRPWLSGGSAGPEGSILAIPVMALAAIFLLNTTSRSEWSEQHELRRGSS